MESSYNRFKFNYILFWCTVRGMRVAIDTIVIISKLHNQTATKKFRCSDKICRDARLWPQDTKWIKWKNVRRKRANSSLVHFDGIRLLRNNLCGEKWFILYSSSSTIDLTQFSLDKILHNHCYNKCGNRECVCVLGSQCAVYFLNGLSNFFLKPDTLLSFHGCFDGVFVSACLNSFNRMIYSCCMWTFYIYWRSVLALNFSLFFSSPSWNFFLVFFDFIFFVFWYNITLKNVCAASQIYWGRLTLSCKW